MEEREITK